MAATYTFDVFTSLDGFSSVSGGDWTGYWGKQGPELLGHRLAQQEQNQRIVFGATTFRQFVTMRGSRDDYADAFDPWVTRMTQHPITVVSSTMTETLGWPDASIVKGDGVEIVRRLKEESAFPLRSHGSLSLNQALLAAGLVDRLQLTIFPAVTGRHGEIPVFDGIEEFDLELLDSTVLDGRTHELVYRPTRH